jgi:hypothetical protein
MARESQGLQIAMIVCVMFMIIFMVAFGMTLKYHLEQKEQVKQLTEAAAKTDGDLKKSQASVSQLLQKMGFPPAPDQADGALAQAQKDVAFLAYPAVEQTYRKALEHRTGELKAQNDKYNAHLVDYRKLEAKVAQLEAASQAQIAAATDASQKAGKDLETERGKFVSTLTAVNKVRETLLAQIGAAKDQADKADQEAKARIAQVEKEKRDLTQALSQRNTQLEKMTKPTFEVAHGKIEWVDQHNRNVWINLGYSDQLNRLTTFSIYDSKTTDVTRGAEKAKIEVTDILGPSLAVARIVEDKNSDPILVGDLIHTPVWEPGQQRHFALVGDIDVDGDGKSDQKMVVDLIHLNRGVIDSMPTKDEKGLLRRVNEKGEKAEISTATNYLVVGKTPDEKAGKEELADFTAVKKAADQYGVKVVGVQDFLRMMGYKSDPRVMNYRNPHPQLLKTEGPEGSQKKSSGNVSPLFQPREAPQRRSVLSY